jgi:hypothetical protein
MVHEQLPIVMNVLCAIGSFCFLEDCTSNCMDLALVSPAEYERACLEGSDPTHEPWPRAITSDGSYSTTVTVNQPRSMRLCISKRHAK